MKQVCSCGREYHSRPAFMAHQAECMSERNRQFVEGYELKGDGSMGDRLMVGMKRALAEEAALTPAQRQKLKRQYKKKMAKVMAGITEELRTKGTGGL